MLFLKSLISILPSLVFAAPVAQIPSNVYTVILNASHPASSDVHTALSRLGLYATHPDVHHVYNNSAFQGFSLAAESHRLDLLREHPEYALVEKVVQISTALTDRENSTWGLQRISSAGPLTGSLSDLSYTYSYFDKGLGQGADIYILDSGLYTSNVAFGNRARLLWTFDNNITDNDGHGTHVAGIAGGDPVGVASDANLLGVKVLDQVGSGWSSNVIAGIDYVIQAHDRRKSDSSNSTSPFVGSVISMSLETSTTVTAITQAIHAASHAGIHVVVAAGNSATDACASSPASAGGESGPAITVGSISYASTVSTFSNTGPCVDVYAPGENILSAWISNPEALQVLSGTSMATPHVTGLVAYAMANATLARSPGLMKEWVRMTALQGAIGGTVLVGDSMLLANNGVPGRVGDEEGILGFARQTRTA